MTPLTGPIALEVCSNDDGDAKFTIRGDLAKQVVVELDAQLGAAWRRLEDQVLDLPTAIKHDGTIDADATDRLSVILEELQTMHELVCTLYAFAPEAPVDA